MARWWTRPLLMLAALGVLAALLLARLPRTPITQHTSGAGSGEQDLQEALTTYRQLAQAQPRTYLPKVAMTLHNLGLLYRDTQRPRESEQAYQEALTIRRQLARAQPHTYVPNVATARHSLTLLYRDTQRLSDGEQD